MQFTCNAAQLNRALTHANLMTTRHASLPALQHVRVDAQEKQVVLRATNLSIGAEFTIPASVTAPGVCLIDISLALGVVGALPAMIEVSVTLDGNLLIVKTDRSESTMKTLALEDFPTLPRIENPQELQIQAGALVGMWNDVVYAASQSDIKPEISSVFMHVHEPTQELVAVCTDSFRLSERRENIKEPIAMSGSMIPVKNISIASRVLNDYEKELIHVDLGETQVSFRSLSGDLYMTSRLVDGNYPEYHKIIPKEFSSHVTLLKSDLVQALKALNVFADKFYQIDMTIDPEKQHIVVVSQHPERGQHTTDLAARIEGEALSIRLNARYLQDCLGSIKSSSIVLSFTDPTKPMIVQGLDQKGFLYLVMPMYR